MNSTENPMPTDVVVSKFFNGFMNGYILERNWTSNISDTDMEIEFLMSVWKLGVLYGAQCRNGAMLR